MRFRLIDRVIETREDSLVALKQVSAAEEYLGDHFPSFRVLPGVMMLESLVQSARELLRDDGDPWVLGSVRALKYGAFVRPGMTLRSTVTLVGRESDKATLKGLGELIDPSTGEVLGTAVSGRFELRRLDVVDPAIVRETAADLSAVGGSDPAP